MPLAGEHPTWESGRRQTVKELLARAERENEILRRALESAKVEIAGLTASLDILRRTSRWGSRPKEDSSVR